MVPGVSRKTYTKARRRWSVAVAVVVIPATTLLSTGADASISDLTPCCAEVVAAPSTNPAALSASAWVGATPNGPMEASARAARGVVRQTLPVGVAPEKGLQVKTVLAARAVSGMFPEILNIGGVRADSMRWHPNGLAIDVMIPNYGSAEGKALGDRIVAFVLDNAERFGLQHALWRQTSFGPGRPPRPMSGRGSDTANHYDHVHIATSGGGYPTGHETYLS